MQDFTSFIKEWWSGMAIVIILFIATVWGTSQSEKYYGQFDFHKYEVVSHSLYGDVIFAKYYDRNCLVILDNGKRTGARCEDLKHVN